MGHVLDTLYAGILSVWIFSIHFYESYRSEEIPYFGLEYLELYCELRWIGHLRIGLACPLLNIVGERLGIGTRNLLGETAWV